ncbi:hypothetical protein MKEN_00279400 [Mycena kentingensis (nom. inval.)]|nr:hypothetical protein MKEN_00279400 [Mycena kentingensis (nom. inval.)]
MSIPPASGFPPPLPMDTSRSASLPTHDGPLLIHPGSQFPPQLVLENEARGIACAVCRTPVGFRTYDGGLTLEHWEAHMVGCYGAIILPPQMGPPQTRQGTSGVLSSAPLGQPIVEIPHPCINDPRAVSEYTAAMASASDRKRKAEEAREATLRDDPLIRTVKPHRVLCAVCTMWVKLSDARAYYLGPWNTHRASCEAKHKKKVRQILWTHASSEQRPRPSVPPSPPPLPGPARLVASPGWSTEASAVGSGRSEQDEPVVEDQSGQPTRFELKSPASRNAFIVHSIEYLFSTTYSPTDTLIIAVLVDYLNVALPAGRYDDFGTPEVARAVGLACRKQNAQFVFEGDGVRVRERAVRTRNSN